MGSYYDLEPSTPTLHTVEDDDINARLATLEQKQMVHSLRIMTLENAEHNEERMEGSDLEHLPQPTYLGNRGKYELFDEWKNSIEHLNVFMTDKPIDMEVEEEAMDYMDLNPHSINVEGRKSLLGATTIAEATTELKN